MQFGEVIKNTRKERKLTQEKLGIMLGKTQGQISEWEKDVIEPSSEDKINLCKALNISLHKLYGMNDDFDIAVEAAKVKGMSPGEMVKAIEMYLLYEGRK